MFWYLNIKTWRDWCITNISTASSLTEQESSDKMYAAQHIIIYKKERVEEKIGAYMIMPSYMWYV